LGYIILFAGNPSEADPVKVYTLNDDFDEGALVGLEHDTVPDQLQLSVNSVTLPFIWVPNNQGTVSKVNTDTGEELGRYWVAPHASSPSRTTVDLNGDCWVGCRQAGTVVKIGLSEAGHFIDRNGNGVMDTSSDLNGDGNIAGPGELLPWGQDECVLFEVVLISGKEGAFAPGTYTGGYDYGHWNTSPRGIAVDDNNHIWAGTWSSRNYYEIDGDTGAILRTIDVSPWGHSAYGAVVDKNGILWSAYVHGYHILRIDTKSNPLDISIIDMGGYVYGMGLDYNNHLFASGWTDRKLHRININTGILEWTKDRYYSYTGRGVACTEDGDVWVACTNYHRVNRYDNNGNLKARIYVGNGPTGVSVDAEGYVWVCNLNDEYIKRIDPSTNTVVLSKRIIGSSGHYSYSDMTGIIARNITAKVGTWTVTADSGEDNSLWGKITWNTEPEGNIPAGASISVKARAGNTQGELSIKPFIDVLSGVLFTDTGRLLEVQTTLQANSVNSRVPLTHPESGWFDPSGVKKSRFDMANISEY